MFKTAILLILATTPLCQAGPVEVVNVTASEGAGGWRFDVVVLHSDEGWAHYVDMWQVAGADGTVFGMQVVAKPQGDNHRARHAMNRVQIPDDVPVVVVSAHDTQDGWGQAYPLTLPR